MHWAPIPIAEFDIPQSPVKGDFASEDVFRLLARAPRRGFTRLGHPDLMDGFFGSRLYRLGHIVQDVARFVEPATLLPSLRVCLAKRCPKPQRAVPDRKLRILSQSKILQIRHCLEDTDDRTNASVSYSPVIKHSPTNPNYRMFLRRLVKPKTMEDFHEMIAEQEALQRRIRDPFGNASPKPYGLKLQQDTLATTLEQQPFGLDLVTDRVQSTQTTPVNNFPYGATGR